MLYDGIIVKMPRFRSVAAVSALAGGLLLALALSGCPQAKKVAVDSGEKTTTTVDQVKVVDDKGNTFESGKSLPRPAELPADVVLYPRATITLARGEVVGGEMAFTLALDTADPQSQVTEYFQTELPNAGWTMDAAQVGSEYSVLRAVKDTRELRLIINNKRSGAVRTTIDLSTGPIKE